MLKWIFILCTWMLSFSLGAQNFPAIEWEKTFGGSGNDEAYAITANADGSFSIAGFTESNESGNKELLIIKVDKSGNKVIDNSGYNSNFEWVSSGVSISGSAFYSGGDSYISDVVTDCYTKLPVIKFKKNNSGLLNETLNKKNEENEIQQIVVTQDKSYVMLGVKQKKYSSKYNWLMKVNKSGQKQWKTGFMTGCKKEAGYLTTTLDKNYIVVGSVKAKGDSGNDFWICKIDNDGNRIWEKTIDKNASDYANLAVNTSDSGFVIAGHARSKNSVSGDFIIMKLNKFGDAEWYKAFGGLGQLEANTLVNSKDGCYIVAGSTTSGSEGGKDAWILKLGRNGEIIWDKTFGGGSDDEANSVVVTGNGGCVVAGYTSSKGNGQKDFWIFKMAGTPPALEAPTKPEEPAMLAENTPPPAESNEILPVGEENSDYKTRGSGDPLKGLNVSKASNILQVGNYYALVIGIDNYTGAWTQLKNAVSDAKAIELVLKAKYKFDVFKVIYNQDATRKNIIKELEWLVDNVTEKDNVLIFYSGHGEFKENLNKGYWVPIDAQSRSTSEFISNSDLQTYLGGIKAKHTLLVSDACFGGDILRGQTLSVSYENTERYYKEVHNLLSRQALTSGGVEPVADGGREGHSIFSYYLVKALKDNENKFFDVSQVYNKIKIPVINNSEQNPVLQPIKNAGDEGGQFIFIKK